MVGAHLATDPSSCLRLYSFGECGEVDFLLPGERYGARWVESIPTGFGRSWRSFSMRRRVLRRYSFRWRSVLFGSCIVDFCGDFKLEAMDEPFLRWSLKTIAEFLDFSIGGFIWRFGRMVLFALYIFRFLLFPHVARPVCRSFVTSD